MMEIDPSRPTDAPREQGHAPREQEHAPREQEHAPREQGHAPRRPETDPGDSIREPGLIDAPGDRPAWRAPSAWLTLGITFATGLAFDLWSKAWAFRSIAGYPVELERERVLGDPSFFVPHHARVVAIPADLLDFRLVLNHGAVFGIGQQQRGLFIAFTLLATIAAVALFSRGTRAGQHAAHVAIGMILAGGLGNLYDRIFYGAVRDFLHMLPGWELPNGWSWPGNPTGEVFPWVFNVADVLLLAGMGLFIVTSWIEDRRVRRVRDALAAPGAGSGSRPKPASPA